MADFATAYAVVMRNEGGYANIGGDAGGETYAGIARNFHPEWSGWAVVDAAKKVRTLKNNEHIAGTEAAVMDFYRTNYWTLRGLGGIADQRVANLVMDTLVQHGYGGRIVQQGINAAYPPANLKLDNSIGPATIRAINAIPASSLLDHIVAVRLDYVRGLSSVPQSLKPSIYKRISAMGSGVVAGVSAAGLLLAAGAVIVAKKLTK